MKLKTIKIFIPIILICLFLVAYRLDASDKAKVLLINSNASIEKYKIVQNEFQNALPDVQVNIVDLGQIEATSSQIREMKAFNPDLVYCIGSKSYSLASVHFSEKKILFSSIINWMRMKMTPKTYGVSNELHPRMPLFIVRSLFPNIGVIGVMYSKQFTQEWFENVKDQASEMQIRIVGKEIFDKGKVEDALDGLLSSTDMVWLISDPMVMPDKSGLFKILRLSDSYKKPIFSYHEAFVEVGVTLVVSVDDPTIGRQAAGMAHDLLFSDAPTDKVQFPAGSSVTLDLKKVDGYGIEYNRDALGLVNTIIK